MLILVATENIVCGENQDYLKLAEYFLSAETVRTIEDNELKDVTLSNDNRYLISASRDNDTVKIRDFPSGQVIKTYKTLDRYDYAYSILISKDNKYIIAATEDNRIRVWNFKNGEEVFDLPEQYNIFSLLAISPDNELLLSSYSNSDYIKLWNLNTKELIRTFKGREYGTSDSLAISGNKKYAYFGSAGDVKIIDLADGRIVKTLKVGKRWWGIYEIMAVSDDDKCLAAAVHATIKLFDIESGKELRSFQGHGHTVSSISLSQDNKYMVSGDCDGIVKLWSLETGKEIKTFRGHKVRVRSALISSDNNYIISGSADSTINIWLVDKYDLALKYYLKAGKTEPKAYKLIADKALSDMDYINAIKFYTMIGDNESVLKIPEKARETQKIKIIYSMKTKRTKFVYNQDLGRNSYYKHDPRQYIELSLQKESYNLLDERSTEQEDAVLYIEYLEREDDYYYFSVVCKHRKYGKLLKYQIVSYDWAEIESNDYFRNVGKMLKKKLLGIK